VRRRGVLGRLLPSLLCTSSGWRAIIRARVCAVVPGIWQQRGGRGPRKGAPPCRHVVFGANSTSTSIGIPHPP